MTHMSTGTQRQRLPDERSPLLSQSQHSSNSNEPISTDPAVNMGGQVDAGFGHVKLAAAQEKQARKNLNLRYDYYEYFVYSQCLPAWLLLLLRFVMGATCVTVFVYMTVNMTFVNFVPGNSTDFNFPDNDDAINDTTDKPPRNFKRHFYLCYLTIWSYLVITIYFVTALINTAARLICRQSSTVSADFSDDFTLRASGFKSTENLVGLRGDADTVAYHDSSLRQFGLRLQWLLFGVASNAAIIVTFFYFAVLYPMIRSVRPGPVSASDLLVHGFNSVFMLIEVVCSGVPVRIVHGLYTALYGVTYALFSLFYWLPDHTNVIYPVLLDWNNPGLTIGMMCLILFVALPVIQLFWWLIYLTRCFVAGALVSRDAGWSPNVYV